MYSAITSQWDCDIESYDWFRRFECRYFADDFFTEEIQEEIEDVFTDIDDQGPKELMVERLRENLLWNNVNTPTS